MPTKVCSHCKEEKETTHFYPSKNLSLGVSNLCIPCQKIAGKLYYNKHKEITKQRANQWRKDNPQRRREIIIKNESKNKENKAAYSKRRRAIIKDTEQYKLMNRSAAHLRRVRVNKVSGKIKVTALQKIFKKAGGVCVYCGEPSDKLTIDHFQPISKGGKHVGNNIFPCCKSCNSSKNTRPGEDWLFDKFGIKGLQRAILFAENKSFVAYC